MNEMLRGRDGARRDPLNRCAARDSPLASWSETLFRITDNIRGDSAQKSRTISDNRRLSPATTTRASAGSKTGSPNGPGSAMDSSGTRSGELAVEEPAFAESATADSRTSYKSAAVTGFGR